MWKRLRALIVKELLAVWLDKRTRATVIVPPLVQLVIFSYAATFDITNIHIGILNEDPTPATRELVARFEHAPDFAEVIHLERVADIDTAIDSRAAPVVLHIGPDFTRKLMSDRPAPVQMILDGRRSNTSLVIQGYAGRILSAFNEDWAEEHGLAATPARLAPRAWFNPNLHSQWMIVPSLMGVLTMIVTLILTAISVARERELGTLEQLLVTPLRPWEITFGKTVPAILIGLGEGTVIALAAVWWFGIPLNGSVGLLYLALAVYMISVIGVGLFISSLARTQQQAVLGTFLFVVPAILLSGFITPIANMPEWLQAVTQINPLRHFLVIVRGVFLKALPPDLVMAEIWPMLIVGIATLIAAAWLFKRRLY